MTHPRNRCTYRVGLTTVAAASGLLFSALVPVAGHAAVLHDPSPREGTAMAYDEANAERVLSGGDAPAALGDTWTFDGTTWTQQHPATAPTARFGMAMSYDAARSQVVLFGGVDATGALGD